MLSGFPVSAASSATGAPAQIPYLQQPPISGGHVLSVFIITAVLLGILVLALVLSRKAGWLSRWGIHGSGPDEKPEDTLRVLGNTRLGTHTQAFLLQAGRTHFLIVESARQVTLKEIAQDSGAPHDVP